MPCLRVIEDKSEEKESLGIWIGKEVVDAVAGDDKGDEDDVAWDIGSAPSSSA